MAKKETPKKVAKFTAPDGKGHAVYKKGGDIVVDHLGKKSGKWDRINLTKKAGAKTISQGVKATKNYHRKNG